MTLDGKPGTPLSLGLMGGTFDPIHLAHLVTAEAALEQFGLDKVIFVPTGFPPHKQGQVVTPAEHRYQMVVLATESNPRFEVSRTEIDRKGLSFTVDTVTEVKESLPPGSHLYFITGADAILDIENWREPDRLLEKCTFIAAPRPGYPDPLARQGLERIEARYGCRILTVDAPRLDISSRDIRHRVRDFRTIRYLVPQAVEAYIEAYGLYRP